MSVFIASPSRRRKHLRLSSGSALSGQLDATLKPYGPVAKILGRTLIILSRSLSTLLGRPCALQDEESVVDYFT